MSSASELGETIYKLCTPSLDRCKQFVYSLITLIELGSPSRAELHGLVKRPKGFAWWYVDLTTPTGDGLVLIWSLNLPFLPGRRLHEPALSRPALSLAVYRRGRPDFYLLQDYGAAAASARLGEDPLGSGALGHTTFDARLTDDGLRLQVHLDEPVPRSAGRLTGELTLVGAPWRTAGGWGETEHLWAPRVLRGAARASLRLGERAVELEGVGYYDSNFSRSPLQAQGIDRWLWGRVAFPDRSFAYYCVEGADEQVTRVLEQSADGASRTTIGTLHEADVRRGTFGVYAPRQLTLQLGPEPVTLELGVPVDDGPFYQRFLVQGRDARGQAGHGVAEVVVPGAVDRPWQRPFVRMRTHVVGGRNSLWLPLFSGPRAGRVRRLLGGQA